MKYEIERAYRAMWKQQVFVSLQLIMNKTKNMKLRVMNLLEGLNFTEKIRKHSENVNGCIGHSFETNILMDGINLHLDGQHQLLL